MGADTVLGRRCDEAERDIDATRRRITEKADRLQDRLRPKAVLRPLTKRLQETLGEGGEKILDAFRENPVPLALAGLGLGWMLLRDFRGRPRPEGALEEAGEKAAGAVENAKERAAGAVRKVRENVRKASDWFGVTLERNPMLLAAGALAAGIVAGLSVPATDKEEELGGKAAGAIPEKSGAVPAAAPGPLPMTAAAGDDAEEGPPPEL